MTFSVVKIISCIPQSTFSLLIKKTKKMQEVNYVLFNFTCIYESKLPRARPYVLLPRLIIVVSLMRRNKLGIIEDSAVMGVIAW